MPNVTSAPVEAVVEAINSAFGNFNPQEVVPDVEAFLENLPKVFEALTDGLKKVAGRLDEDLPVHKDVGEAVRELAAPLGGLSERAEEAYTTFKSRHAQELDQHYNPRPHEEAWNRR
jgi:phage-related minor tail protein